MTLLQLVIKEGPEARMMIQVVLNTCVSQLCTWLRMLLGALPLCLP
jgi:hypothetical protein